MALRHWLQAFTTLPCFFPTIGAQSSPGIIPPAQVIIPETTAANGPLLELERVQLTNAVIDRIANENVTSSIADLVGFDHNGTTVDHNFTACKMFPGDALWPSQSHLNVFDALLNDGLVPTVPIASPCYDSNWGPKDVAKCNSVVSSFTKFPIHYLGKSTGAGSIALWMHNIKDIIFLPSYEFEGYAGKAFKVGAGVTLSEIYRAADAHGVTVLGGICPSVGYAVGYLQGGGHTPLSGFHGMGADAVLAYQVVTADGRYVTASKTSYPDLFWALRGGGPGTFGIVTSVIVKAFPETDVTLSSFVLGNSTDGTQFVSRANFFKVLRVLWESFPAWTDANTYSFFFVFNTNGQLTLDMRNFFAPGHTPGSYNNLTKPFFYTVKKFGLATSLPGNRLVPKTMWNNPENFEVLWKTVVAHVEAGHHFGIYHQAPDNPQNVDNAVSSAWRNAQSFFITKSANFPENASATVISEANRALHEQILQPWRDITPASKGGGSYLNEAAVDEPNWKEDFYGAQYERLVMIKRKYDPTGVFYATTAIGSDEWEIRGAPDLGVTTQNGRLCRV
ncbi:uncharacterized protein K460DRAFT_392285 [Cucurbitaria berberidis CBS 394.84]|uniref:FAD-binding PCMH-type domain-containing protein n=1 Tax=Cucurbitaria berberidis CBS 394.84 TaxID=1168544 RepID=A0A9P4GV84_9PLEO|nr:uncharacterized protein K460DRAFT_392285 [Cucurbitaria berberidis CBS 394.84]KAF1852164.1 hypothetical protein K460DRAFT_392285 [Cucurbitaria berberidis CBS 394.84]